MKWLARISDIGATKLALVFGFNLTIWVFFIVPLVAEFFPTAVQARVFYYASGWVQLFALPLMVYVSNKIQRQSDEQSARQLEIITEIRETAHANQEIARNATRILNEHERLMAEFRDATGHQPPE